ncbi:hypothetical protein [Nocardioides speluncae]|uniref:hypothetical protein n=1 Tax=Nocardioides speluncae TaxID=2670337 RepID=UPI000D68F88C|nr:hypothetical protein [Nocardioides speluncae]
MTPTEDDVRQMLSDVAQRVQVPDLSAALTAERPRRNVPWVTVVAASAAVLLAVLVPTLVLDRNRAPSNTAEPAGPSGSALPESPSPSSTEDPQSELAQARALVGRSTPLRRSANQRPVVTEEEAIELGNGEKAYGPFRVGYRHDPDGRTPYTTWRTCWIVADQVRWVEAVGVPLDHEGAIPKYRAIPWSAFDATTGELYRGGFTPVEE